MQNPSRMQKKYNVVGRTTVGRYYRAKDADSPGKQSKRKTLGFPLPKMNFTPSCFSMEPRLLDYIIIEYNRRIAAGADRLVAARNSMHLYTMQGIETDPASALMEEKEEPVKKKGVFPKKRSAPKKKKRSRYYDDSSDDCEVLVNVKGMVESVIGKSKSSSPYVYHPKPDGSTFIPHAIHISPDSIWYETYIDVEPVSPSLHIGRDENTVKTEFEHIYSNVYVGKQIADSIKDVNICTCIPSSCCESQCINRLCYCECDWRYCPCGENCHNQFFRRHEYQHLTLFYHAKKGWGLKTKRPIPHGTFLMEYVGEVISKQESESRQLNRKNQVHMYYMSLNPDELIDATEKGNASRFINHSCDPNCEIQKWSTGSTFSVGIFASRDILPGEEITFDYQFERIGNSSAPCFCGSPNCRHILGKTKEIANSRNLSLRDRIYRNKIFSCDSMIDPGDHLSTPTTMLPCVSKMLTQNLTNYIKSYDLTFLPSSYLPEPPLFQANSFDWQSYSASVVDMEEEGEEEMSNESREYTYSRFNGRGRKMKWYSSLMLNRNLSSGLKRVRGMESFEILRIGLVDTKFKKFAIEQCKFSLIECVVCSKSSE